jgi:hypothetical protein
MHVLAAEPKEATPLGGQGVAQEGGGTATHDPPPLKTYLTHVMSDRQISDRLPVCEVHSHIQQIQKCE